MIIAEFHQANILVATNLTLQVSFLSFLLSKHGIGSCKTLHPVQKTDITAPASSTPVQRTITALISQLIKMPKEN